MQKVQFCICDWVLNMRQTSCRTSSSKVVICFISQHYPWNQYAISLQALELHKLSWLSPLSKAFIKKCITFENFISNSLPIQKWRTVQCLTIFNKSSLQHFWTTSAARFVRTVFRRYHNYPKKSHASYIEINLMFPIFNNKGNHSILKRMDAS